ncbi:hypothetical protein A5695_24375 [Mycobacterium sp. E1747]|nr:hypothetical protein A5695_24375 [Mycobacterium sp. E1747]
MVQWLDSGGANNRFGGQYSAVVTDSKWRITARHAVAHHMMGHLLSHLLDGVTIIDRDEQLEYIAVEEGGQRK